jgi:acetyl esterase/lipase
LAWLTLAGVTGLLVQGEAFRAEGPEGVTVFSDLVYREVGGRRLRLDIYSPGGPPAVAGRGRPALVAIHGGGWRGGSKADYGRQLAPLVRQGLVVVAVDYRLSRPGAPSWPGNLDDVREAVRWVRRNAAGYGIDPGRVGVIGASAGGHLALLLGTTAGDDASRVRAVIDFYGPTDLAALFASRTAADRSIGLLLGGPPESFPARSAAASPLQQVAPGDPPVLIVHGSDDALVPLGQSRALADSLRRAGVPHRLVTVPGARHGFGLRVEPTGPDLVPEILGFLGDVWGEPTPGAGAGRGRTTTIN